MVLMAYRSSNEDRMECVVWHCFMKKIKKILVL